MPSDDQCFIGFIIKDFCESLEINSSSTIHVNLLCFYSPRDIWMTFGFNNIVPYFSNKPHYILQNRSIRGQINTKLELDPKEDNIKI